MTAAHLRPDNPHDEEQQTQDNDGDVAVRAVGGVSGGLHVGVGDTGPGRRPTRNRGLGDRCGRSLAGAGGHHAGRFAAGGVGRVGRVRLRWSGRFRRPRGVRVGRHSTGHWARSLWRRGLRGRRRRRRGGRGCRGWSCRRRRRRRRRWGCGWLRRRRRRRVGRRRGRTWRVDVSGRNAGRRTVQNVIATADQVHPHLSVLVRTHQGGSVAVDAGGR